MSLEEVEHRRKQMESKIGKEVVDILNEKIIIIYNNIEELKEILKLIEENSNYKWCDGREKPTEYIPDEHEGHISLTCMGLQYGINKPNEYLYQMKDKYEFSNLKEGPNE
jgi:bacterioferritin (cytochrome b1)